MRPLVVGEIAEADAAGLRHDAGDQRRQPVARASALQAEAREAGQVEDAGGVAHGEAFLADALLPRAVAAEGLRRLPPRCRRPACAYQVARSQPL